MRTITLAIALALIACSAPALAQTSQERAFKFCAEIAQGNMRQYRDCMNRMEPPLSGGSTGRLNGTWTGYEGSPRDIAWVASCNPRIVTDREGINRYVYAKRGCEYGDPVN